MTFKILIVDDSKLARMAVSKALSTLRPDWIRVEASTADEALKIMTVAAPDIALLDFNMPGRSGLDLAADLRQAKPNMPVAIVSANRQQEVLKRTAAVGASFLVKPLTEQALDEYLRMAEQTLGKGQQ